MGLLDKIVDDIFDDRQPRRSRPPEQKNSDKMFIGELLGAYFYKEDIQSFCEDADLKTTGTKEELIGVLLEESDYDVTDYLDALETDQLKDLCDEFDEKVSGTKTELIQRIVPHIELETEPESPPQQSVQAQPPAPVPVQQPPVPAPPAIPQPPAPPVQNAREEEIRRAYGMERGMLYDEAIVIFKKYDMWEDVRRCKTAQQQSQIPQTKIQIGSIDQSTHSAYTDSRNVSTTTNIDNRDAVINRSQFGGSQPVLMKVCPYCGMEFNFPEPPRFCPQCRKQLTQ